VKTTILPVCQLGELATVGLGFKSLQNHFYYLSIDAVAEYGIEKQFLQPIYQMKQLTDPKYRQKKKPTISVFFCREAENDLRGTAALAYMRAMQDRPAAEKKQGGKRQTIREALQAQGGGFWYAPKAALNKSHVWLRKAVGSTHSPFIFDTAAALDQRCNFLRPKGKGDWHLLGALLTSSFFTLSAECSGASSLGAGALELATKGLLELKVIDIRVLSEPEQKDVITLAEAVWNEEQPVDWSKGQPGPKLRALDEWFASRLKQPVNVDRLYLAITETCKTRLGMAEGKKATSKRQENVDIASVAAGIAESVRPLIEAKPFPDAFFDAKSETQAFDFSKHDRLSVNCVPMMGEAVLTVTDGNDKRLVEKQYSRSVAQVIVKALLLGRIKFSVPMEEEAAGQALSAVADWLPKVMGQIDEGFRASTVGTKYEAQVYQEVLRQLAIHPRAADAEVFGELTVAR
jgi:hypothetical protein